MVVRLLDRFGQSRHFHVAEVILLAARNLEIRVVRLPLPVEREQNVVGVEFPGRLEVLQGMELDALAQVKRDRLAAVGDVPALGESWNYLGGAALELGQAVVDRACG